MRAAAVIGAGYGDEGKGLLVDALAARRHGAVVARTNGGAQAGHTVATPDGRRHVFHHLASGALAGASTHLARSFVSAPMLFGAERAAVAAIGGVVAVTADPRGPVTTPWDVAVNQAAETARAGGRHGSCGIGFGETVGRDMLPPFSLSVGDLADPALRERLRAIRDGWMPRRLAALGIGLGVLGPEAEEAIRGDAVLDRFVRDCHAFLAGVALLPDARLGDGRPVILEGAQGLMLDKDRGAFPHVTRSSTGLANMAAVAREAGIAEIDAHYVTRAYVTRHGAGPLPHEGAVPFDIDDPTNAPNAWQGAIRTAPLDADVLSAEVGADLGDAGSLRVFPFLVVTCLDQARGHVPVASGGVTAQVPPALVAGLVARRAGLALAGTSWGPTRAAVDWGTAEGGPYAGVAW